MVITSVIVNEGCEKKEIMMVVREDHSLLISTDLY